MIDLSFVWHWLAIITVSVIIELGLTYLTTFWSFWSHIKNIIIPIWPFFDRFWKPNWFYQYANLSAIRSKSGCRRLPIVTMLTTGANNPRMHQDNLDKYWFVKLGIVHGLVIGIVLQSGLSHRSSMLQPRPPFSTTVQFVGTPIPFTGARLDQYITCVYCVMLGPCELSDMRYSSIV